MLNSKSLVTKGVLTAMAVVSIGSASIGIVKANNSDDSGFSFDFEYAGDVCDTDERAKLDTSAAYMYCTYADDDSSYYATVFGRSDGTSAKSCSNTYRYYEGCKRYQSNTVNEEGYDKAFFRAYSSSEFVSCGGVWSPDNVNQYQ